MSRGGNAPKSKEESHYLNALFTHLDDPRVKDAYITPVMDKLLLEVKRGRSRGYEGNFKAFKRAVAELADNWKLEHGSMSGLGISKAAADRQVEQVTRAIMEVFLARMAK
jgi:hypothetical protein